MGYFLTTYLTIFSILEGHSYRNICYSLCGLWSVGWVDSYSDAVAEDRRLVGYEPLRSIEAHDGHCSPGLKAQFDKGSRRFFNVCQATCMVTLLYVPYSLFSHLIYIYNLKLPFFGSTRCLCKWLTQY